MSYNKQYYQNKKLELVQKTQRNVQRFINQAFDFVSDSNDLTKRMKELEEMEKKSIEENKKKEKGVKAKE